MICHVPFFFFFFRVTARSPSSSGDSNDDDDKDSKSEDESDSSDDTFVKDNYYSSSSVWRSYTTRGQVKGNKEGELAASLGGVSQRNTLPVFLFLSLLLRQRNSLAHNPP